MEVDVQVRPLVGPVLNCGQSPLAIHNTVLWQHAVRPDDHLNLFRDYHGLLVRVERQLDVCKLPQVPVVVVIGRRKVQVAETSGDTAVHLRMGGKQQLVR